MSHATVVAVLVLLAAGASAAPTTRTYTVKLVKKDAGMCTTRPVLKALTPFEGFALIDKPTFRGENEREVFFTFKASDERRTVPKLAIIAPGVEPLRVITGRDDCPFERKDGEIVFVPTTDTSKAMQIQQVVADPEHGWPIHLDHNWSIRKDGPFRDKPYPEVECRAQVNWLFGVREALKLIGGIGPDDQRPFKGTITLMSFEVACSHGHMDAPPHFHVMLWVPGYSGSEIPHFYLDGEGKIARNGFGIIGAEEGPRTPERDRIIADKKKRNGEYGPGKPCGLFDLDGKLALELTITEKGGLLIGRGAGAEPLLVIGDVKGPADAVLVQRKGQTLARIRATDNAADGVLHIAIEYFEKEQATRKVEQTLYYDPFTAKPRAAK